MRTRYRSTRGTELVSFEEALLRGLATDGGLFVPDAIPRIDFSAIFPASDDFSELGLETLRSWVGAEMPSDVLTSIVRDALSFPVPLVPLAGNTWKDVFVLELFHGPTLSFKDFGARTMARWMDYFLEVRDECVTVLVATSGDTGSAVADGYAGRARIDVVLLYPGGGVSPVQERQLIVRREGVRALAVAGDFDDCQRLVKEAFMEGRPARRRLSSANSINVGRLLPQMLYYVWAVRLLGRDDVLFCVPSGNLGNLTGGVMAHLSGLPVQGFLAAHNANDFFPRFLAGGDDSFAPTVRTLSNAMDVGAPSNFERMRVLLEPHQMRRLIQGARVTDDETLESMRRVHDETGYVADPHTAVGLEAVRRARAGGQAGGPVVVLSTAHPAKFPETVAEALGQKPEVPEGLAALWNRDVDVERIEPRMDALRERMLQTA